MSCRATWLFSAHAWSPLVAAALLAAVAAESEALQPAEPATSAAAEALVAVDYVRLRLFSGEVVEGRLWAASGDMLLLRDGRGVSASGVQVAESLTRRTGSLATRGALLGAGLGLALASSAVDAQDELFALQVGFLVGVVSGGIAGALVGARRFRGDTVYTASAVAAQTPATGLIGYRVGGNRGAIRTRFAITTFVGSANYSRRAKEVGTAGREFGISPTPELGVQLQYALGPRYVVRLGGSVMRGSLRWAEQFEATIGYDRYWLTRGEVGVEFRMRANVPGYFVTAVDGLNNPHGYVLNNFYQPSGADAGISPRFGAGIGYDVFGAGDRRLRFEWIYRVGRYTPPEPAGRYEGRRITHDKHLTIGLHFPVIR